MLNPTFSLCTKSLRTTRPGNASINFASRSSTQSGCSLEAVIGNYLSLPPIKNCDHAPTILPLKILDLDLQLDFFTGQQFFIFSVQDFHGELCATWQVRLR